MGREAASFSVVNVVATVVAIVLFNLLVHGWPMVFNPGPLNGWPVTAWFIANCIGMAISFYGSRRFAFRHRRPSGPGGGALIFAAVNLASFVIPMGCLWFTRNVLDWQSALADNVSANVVGAALGMLFRFWAFRRFVFKKRRSAGQEEADDADDHPDSGGAPELGPDEAEVLEHQSKQGQADSDDVVRVSGHAGDERAAETVEGEGPRYR